MNNEIRYIIRKQLEDFIIEHIHSKTFYETLSDVYNDKYYVMCCVCGDSRYVDILNYYEYAELYGDILTELEEIHGVKFINSSCGDV
ncbi:MAG: hypothetical protein QXR31_04485 [Zestosphaera sp.]